MGKRDLAHIQEEEYYLLIDANDGLEIQTSSLGNTNQTEDAAVNSEHEGDRVYPRPQHLSLFLSLDQYP